jgi:Na+/H+-dicarboxylate symporter
VIPAAQARQKRSASSRFWRAIGVLFLIAVLAALIAGAVLLLTDAGQNTDVGQTIKDNLKDQVQAIEDFIRNNTQ